MDENRTALNTQKSRIGTLRTTSRPRRLQCSRAVRARAAASPAGERYSPVNRRNSSNNSAISFQPRRVSINDNPACYPPAVPTTRTSETVRAIGHRVERNRRCQGYCRHETQVMSEQGQQKRLRDWSNLSDQQQHGAAMIASTPSPSCAEKNRSQSRPRRARDDRRDALHSKAVPMTSSNFRPLLK